MSSDISSSVVENVSEDFAPSAEELESFFVMLESGNVLELQWQSPGRRPISPEGTSKVETNAVTENTEAQEPIKNDFDFSDDMAQQNAHTHLRVRNQNATPKKKKMANFAGVMEVLKKKNAEG